MRHIGHPLFSDVAYGGDAIVKGTTFSKYRQFVMNCFEVLPRQALHARVLGFEHPSSKKHMHFESPLPEDMTQCLERWRNYSKNSSSV
jgi:23S rRNA pseudouridine1911/1915/1917 synthase